MRHISQTLDVSFTRLALLWPSYEGSSFPGCCKGSLGSHLHLAPRSFLGPSYFTSGPDAFPWGDAKSVMFHHTGTTELVTAGVPQGTQATRLVEPCVALSRSWDVA